MKQGIIKGFYYSGVIIELFFMSKVLSEGFSSHEILGVLLFFDVRLRERMKQEKRSSADDLSQFFMLLFIIPSMFKSTYNEIKVFFTKNKKPFKEKMILFFHSAFQRSLHVYEEFDSLQIITVKPLLQDFFYIGAETTIFLATLLLTKFVNLANTTIIL